MSRLATIRTNIETADENVKLLCASLKTELDTNAGTTRSPCSYIVTSYIVSYNVYYYY